jgi:hypothetical protein
LLHTLARHVLYLGRAVQWRTAGKAGKCHFAYQTVKPRRQYMYIGGGAIALIIVILLLIWIL